jgi:TonB-dependent Receptor Plug Domain
MRLSVFSSLAALFLAGLLACSDKPLTGPDAQAAYSQAVVAHPALPNSVLVYVDGRRLPAGSGLPQLDPKTIARIEVIKGDVAAKQYGAAARNGVIQIYTTQAASTAARP